MAAGKEASGRRRRSSAARILAPLALLATAFAVILIVSASTGDGGGGYGRDGAADTRQERTAETGENRTEDRPPKRYVIQPNDSLLAIAEEFGLTVEEIQRLNPDVDPQALVTGQELKLR